MPTVFRAIMKKIIHSIAFSALIIGSLFFVGRSSFAASDEIINYPTVSYRLIEVLQNGEQRESIVKSANVDPRKIANDSDLKLYEEDRISAFPDPKLYIGSTITLVRAPKITIKDGKKVVDYHSWVSTVGELLDEKNIELGNDDKISKSTSAKISDGDYLTITRVAITNISETKSIDYKTLKKDDPNLDYGKTRTVAGVKGEKKLTYRVRREDGEEVERTLLSAEITKEPTDEIIYSGTKVTVIASVSGRATMTTVSGYVVSPNYPKGALIRITNRSNGASIIVTVNATWGTASAPDGVVLDLAPTFLSQLKCPSHGCANVLVERLKQ